MGKRDGWIPPENPHHVLLPDTPYAISSSETKRHQLIDIILANLPEAISRILAEPVLLNWVRASLYDVVPILVLKLMKPCHDFMELLSVAKLVSAKRAFTIENADTPREGAAL